MNDPTSLDSFSSPNLSRYRHGPQHSASYRGSTHLNSSSTRYYDNLETPSHHHHRYLRQQHHQSHSQDPQASVAAQTSSDDKEDGGGVKMSRSERKRMWRKNLSAEKLAKLRERDALRKRVERMNMSAEKRRDLRTKDTARKAALRRERRMSESVAGAAPGNGDATSGDTDVAASRDHGKYSDLSNDVSRRNGRGHGSTDRNAADRLVRSSNKHSSDDQFNKIPVHTLLN